MATVTANSLISINLGAGVRSDPKISIENRTLQTVVRDAGAGIEFSGAAGVGRDNFAPIEVLHGTAGDSWLPFDPFATVPTYRFATSDMTSPPIFIYPTLPTLSFSVHWMPTYATIISTHVSGREVASPQQAYPLHEFTLTYEVLRDQGLNQSIYQPNNPFTELQQIAGLFLACNGQYGWFYFDYFADDSRSDAPVGTGDGVTTNFVVPRAFGPFGFTEPVGGLKSVSAVYFNGVPQSSGSYSINGNQLVFTSAPGSGVVITADFMFYYLCRFIDDQSDYEQFFYQLYTLKTCKFRSVKQ